MKKLLLTTYKDILINGAGMFFAALISFAFFILLSRYLGSVKFGIFSALIAVSTLISDISDGGVSAGLAYFVGKSAAGKKSQNLGKLLAGSLILRISLTLVFAIFSFLLAEEIVQLAFGSSGANLIQFYISITGVMVLSLFSFSIFALQARRKYFATSFANVIGNLTRLILLLVVSVVGVISIELGLGIYFFGLIISIILASLFLPFTTFSKPTKKEFTEIIKFNKWLAAGTLLFAIFTRIDTVFVVSLSGAEQAGLYAAATRVTFVFPLIASTLVAVWSPRFSVFAQRQIAVDYFKKSFIFILLIALGVFLVLPLSGTIISVFFGEEYLAASGALSILLIGWLMFLLGIPAVQFITYYLGRPDVYAFLTIVQFLVIIGLDILLIPQFGAIGAASAFLVGNLSILLPAYLLSGFIKAVPSEVNFGKGGVLQRQ